MSYGQTLEIFNVLKIYVENNKGNVNFKKMIHKIAKTKTCKQFVGLIFKGSNLCSQPQGYIKTKSIDW